MEVTIDNLNDMCALMCDNVVPQKEEKPVLHSDSVKEMFPDWAEIEVGNWSACGKLLRYGREKQDVLEIGLYREPLENTEYAGRYTLQIFDGDTVIFCKDVDDER